MGYRLWVDIMEKYKSKVTSYKKYYKRVVK